MPQKREELILPSHVVLALLFQPLALRDVSVDLENPEALGVVAGLQRPSAFDDEAAAAAARLDEFPLPMTRAFHDVDDVRQRFGKTGLQQFLRGLAERFFAVPSVALRRALVPVQNAALLISHEDVVVCE